MKLGNALRLAIFAALSLAAAASHAQSCGQEQYYGPNDANSEFPLQAPHADFQKTLRAAQRGNAAEARNLAAFYESGFLVSVCPEKAAQWYSKAARQGDAVAKAWIERHSAMQDIRTRRECFGDNCLARSASGVQRTVLQSSAGGAYIALVTINGRTVRGLVDTGATFVSMSARTASELGIEHRNGRQLQMQTANGTKLARAVMLDSISVGNITLKDVQAVVGDSDHPLLIGMSFLSRLKISTAGSGMTLEKE